MTSLVLCQCELAEQEVMRSQYFERVAKEEVTTAAMLLQEADDKPQAEQDNNDATLVRNPKEGDESKEVISMNMIGDIAIISNGDTTQDKKGGSVTSAISNGLKNTALYSAVPALYQKINKIGAGGKYRVKNKKNEMGTEDLTSANTISLDEFVKTGNSNDKWSNTMTDSMSSDEFHDIENHANGTDDVFPDGYLADLNLSISNQGNPYSLSKDSNNIETITNVTDTNSVQINFENEKEVDKHRQISSVNSEIAAIEELCIKSVDKDDTSR